MAGNQFASKINVGERQQNERDMASLMSDLNISQKKHSRFGKSTMGFKNSDEYTAVQDALMQVAQSNSKSFSTDVAENAKMVTQRIREYYKLLAACEEYINKPGGRSISGRARKNKVKEIQRYAQRDLTGIEQAFYAMKSMTAEEQSRLNWDQIIHSARMETVKVDDYNDQSINIGGEVKKGANVGKMLTEGIFAPNVNTTYGKSSLTSSSLKDKDEAERVNNVSTNMTNRNVATSRVANLIGMGGLV